MMRDYVGEYEGNVTAAVLAMTADLMRGDAVTFQRGYTFDNALLAAADRLAGPAAGEVLREIGTLATAAFLLGQAPIIQGI
jgi:hypothetical protein